MINKVILIGNLGKDPEIRTLESGASVARFPVATNENYKDKSGEWQTVTEWHNIVAWRNLAQRAERDLKKGSLVFIEGKISTRKWQDRDGNDRYSTDITALTLRPLEKREASDNDFGGFQGLENSVPAAPQSKQDMPDSSGPREEEDDDLPF